MKFVCPDCKNKAYFHRSPFQDLYCEECGYVLDFVQEKFVEERLSDGE